MPHIQGHTSSSRFSSAADWRCAFQAGAHEPEGRLPHAMPQLRLRYQTVHGFGQHCRVAGGVPRRPVSLCRTASMITALVEPMIGQACAMASGDDAGQALGVAVRGDDAEETSRDHAQAMCAATGVEGQPAGQRHAAGVSAEHLQRGAVRTVADAGPPGSSRRRRRGRRTASASTLRRCPFWARSGRRTGGRAGLAARGVARRAPRPRSAAPRACRIGTPCASAASATAAETQTKWEAAATTAGQRLDCASAAPVLRLADVAAVQHDQPAVARSDRASGRASAPPRARCAWSTGATWVRGLPAGGRRSGSNARASQPAGPLPPSKNTLPPSAGACGTMCAGSQTDICRWRNWTEGAPIQHG